MQKFCRKCGYKKLSKRNSGENNPFYGEKHSKECLEHLKELRSKRPKPTGKRLEALRKCMIENGKKKGSLSNFECWKRKYGLEEANLRQERFIKKNSERNSGKNNPMFGKPSPKKSGNGWGGWYKQHYFRSLHELSYIVNNLEKNDLKWTTGESKKLKIKYVFNGNDRNYFADFLVENKYLIECKPKKLWKTKIVKAKARAAVKFCKQHSLKYKLCSPKILPFYEILRTFNAGEVRFTDKTLEKFTLYKKTQGAVLMFTGLSGSGKSTIAAGVKEVLGMDNVKILDGDKLRSGINSDLGFSKKDRKENIRRASEIAKLYMEDGNIVIMSFILPFKELRDYVKCIIGRSRIYTIFISCSLNKCEQRDVKGLYKKARANKIKNFTGVSQEYQVPNNYDLQINTESEIPEISTNMVANFIRENVIK